MMESLEISGRTVEEAIQLALDQLGVEREEVEITVLDEGKSGILGLGAEEALIRVRLLSLETKQDSEVVEKAKATLLSLLDLMGIEGSIVSQDEPIIQDGQENTDSVVLNIHGEDLGILIGRRGQTLSCLQYIVRLIIGHQTNVWAPIVIDIEGYKQRRYRALQVFARDMAERVKNTGSPFALEPMPAYERRIVHLALVDHPDIVTESIGQGESRRVVIQPREQ